MKKFLLIFLSFALYGCPNDSTGPEPIISFDFPKRVENLEDAFHNLDISIKEITTSHNVQYNKRYPTFQIQLKSNDTIIDYEIRLDDCQGFRELAMESNWNCEKSNINVMYFSSNKKNVTDSIAFSLLDKKIKTKMDSILSNDNVKYNWEITKKGDSTIISTFDQSKRIRKERIFGNIQRDTTSDYKNITLLQVNDYRTDSIYQYIMDSNYYYLRIRKIKTLPNNGNRCTRPNK